jgi:hypothetical protein
MRKGVILSTDLDGNVENVAERAPFMEYAFSCIFSTLTTLVMRKPRYKKIYYVPGVISLLVLPVLFVVCVSIAQKPKGYHTLPLFMLGKQLQQEYSMVFEGRSAVNRSVYEDIHLTGNRATDQIKLAYAQVRIREILRQNNFREGVLYRFSDSANYGAFVKAIDILTTEKEPYYLLEDNNIWFHDVPPDTIGYGLKANQPLPYPCLCNDVFYVQKPLPPEPVLTRLKDAWASSWLLIVSFSLFLVVALARLRYRLGLK